MFPLALPTNIYGVLTGRGGVQSTEFTSKGSQRCGVEQRGVGGSSRTQQTAPASCWTFRFLHVILKHPKFSSDQQCLLCGVQSSEGWGMEPSGQDFPVFVLDSEDPSPLQPRCTPVLNPEDPPPLRKLPKAHPAQSRRTDPLSWVSPSALWRRTRFLFHFVLCRISNPSWVDTFIKFNLNELPKSLNK